MHKKRWRPLKWSNPYPPSLEFNAYEGGATEMLEALRPLILRLSNKANSLMEADYLIVKDILEG